VVLAPHSTGRDVDDLGRVSRAFLAMWKWKELTRAQLPLAARPLRNRSEA